MIKLCNMPRSVGRLGREYLTTIERRIRGTKRQASRVLLPLSVFPKYQQNTQLEGAAT